MIRFWLKHHIPQVIAVLFWVAMIIVIYRTLDSRNLTLAQFFEDLEGDLSHSVHGPLVFLILFSVFRPFTLIPTVIILALGGRIFGLGWGFLLGVLGMTFSAVIPFYAGRLFAGEEGIEKHGGLVRAYVNRLVAFLKANATEALILMRMTHIPYDLVSFTAGNLHVPLGQFMWATLIGNIPAAYPFAALGASFEGSIFDGDYSLNEGMLLSSVLVFVLSMLIARYFKARDFDFETLIRRTQEFQVRRDENGFHFERAAPPKPTESADQTPEPGESPA